MVRRAEPPCSVPVCPARKSEKVRNKPENGLVQKGPGSCPACTAMTLLHCIIVRSGRHVKFTHLHCHLSVHPPVPSPSHIAHSRGPSRTKRKKKTRRGPTLSRPRFPASPSATALRCRPSPLAHRTAPLAAALRSRPPSPPRPPPRRRALRRVAAPSAAHRACPSALRPYLHLPSPPRSQHRRPLAPLGRRAR